MFQSHESVLSCQEEQAKEDPLSYRICIFLIKTKCASMANSILYSIISVNWR